VSTGLRFGRSPGGIHRAGVAGTVPDVPPTPVTSVDPVPRVEYRFPTITAQMRTVEVFGVTAPVAELLGPPRGQIYVIERMLVTNYPNAANVSVFAGALENSSIRDTITGATATALVAADAAPIVLVESTPLRIVWTGPASAAGYYANLQVRVEEI
jgi:hypothetical protein